jgi:cytochrome P450
MKYSNGHNDAPVELFSEEFRQNPYPTLRFLRENVPLYKTPTGIWIATRYDDVLKILEDNNMERNFERSTTSVYGESELESYTSNIMKHWIVNQTAPFHATLRRYLSIALGEASRGLNPRMESIVERLVNKALGEARFDLVADMTFPMTVEVMCEVVGVPEGEREIFLNGKDFPEPGLLDVVPVTRKQLSVISRQTELITDYLTDLLMRKKTHPGSDFTSKLLEIQKTDPELSDECIVANMFFMFFAGHQSTQNLLSNCLHTLYTHEDQLQSLIENPSLMNGAVEELVRYDTSVQTGHLHYAKIDIQFGDVIVKEGDAVLPILSSANRDAEVNINPDLFDIERDKPKHLSFNAGIHSCIGERMAKTELRILLSGLLQKMPNMYLRSPNEIEYISTYTLRGIKSLPTINHR